MDQSVHVMIWTICMDCGEAISTFGMAVSAVWIDPDVRCVFVQRRHAHIPMYIHMYGHVMFLNSVR